MRHALFVIALLSVSSVLAAVETVSYQGLPQEVYDLNGELVTTNLCEKVGEKEVLVLTRVFADYDGQSEYTFSFFLPGQPPYKQYSSINFAQHRIFIYPEDLDNNAMVNGEPAAKFEDGVYTIKAAGGASYRELVKPGTNEVYIYTYPKKPTQVGALVAEVAATACSDSEWERAATPLYGVESSDCTFGVAQAVPGPDGDVYLCNPAPEAVEVPEMNEVVLAGTAVAGSAAALWWYFRRKRPDAK
jgi:hypothetical protein